MIVAASVAPSKARLLNLLKGLYDLILGRAFLVICSTTLRYLALNSRYDLECSVGVKKKKQKTKAASKFER